VRTLGYYRSPFYQIPLVKELKNQSSDCNPILLAPQDLAKSIPNEESLN